MRRVLAAIVIVMTSAACAVSTDHSVDRISDRAVPFGLLDPSAPAVVPVAGGHVVPICLLHNERLIQVDRQLASGASLQDVARSISALTDSEAARGLQTKLSAPDEIRSVTLEGGTARVDLTSSSDQPPAADPLATIAQLVCTLTDQPGVGLVSFSVNGAPIEVPVANGSLTDRPVTRDDYASMIGAG